MRMPFWMRIALGAFAGAAAVASLTFLHAAPWLAALVAALAAPIVFLGSFFVWSADRLDEGYEQVLFDRPNTLLSAGMIVLFAGAGLATGFLGGAPDPEAFVAEGVAQLREDYLDAARAYQENETDAAETTARLDALRAESDQLAADASMLPEGEARAHLVESLDLVTLAIDALKACIAGEEAACQEAPRNASAAEISYRRYAAAAED